MRFTPVLTALLLLISTAPLLHGQTLPGGNPPPPAANAEGYRFMVGFMQNEIYDDQLDCRPDDIQQIILISSRFATQVTITMPDGTSVQYAVAANSVMKLPLHRSFECIGEGVFNKGIEIVATHPISVTCFSSNYLSSDGYQALPVSAWGSQYVTANYYLDHYSPDLIDSTQPEYYCMVAPRGGEFAVIAAYDSTVVTITPNAATAGGMARGRSYTRTLKKGDVYQVQDGGQRKGESDLTGSLIVSNKPVGVLSGHMRAAVPITLETKNHLIEMIPPFHRLGVRYLIVPFGGHRGGDRVRIVAKDRQTMVAIQSASGSVRIDTIDEFGGYIEVLVEEVSTILASQPVLVAQYCQSNAVDTSKAFDAFMVVVTPEDQFVRNAIVQTLPAGTMQGGGRQFDHQYMTIVAESNAFNTIRVNGENLSAMPGLVTGTVLTTGYRWATLELQADRSYAIEGESLFGGYLYGVGRADSYGWPIVGSGESFCIPKITPAGPIRLCDGDSVTLDAGIARSHAWSNGATTRTIRVGRAGSYSVTTVDTSGCTGSSAPVSVSIVKIPPVLLSPGGPVTLCAGDSLTLSLPEGFASYRWSTGETARTIVIRNSGMYWAWVVMNEGCSAITDTLNVSMHTAKVPVITREGDMLSTGSAAAYKWFRDGASIEGEVSRTIQPQQSGRYTVRTVDWNGCVAESAPFDVTWLGVESEEGTGPLRLSEEGVRGRYMIEGRVSGRGTLRVELVDMLGRRVMSTVSEEDGDVQVTLALEHLPAGSYLLRVNHGSATQVWRVVMQ